LRGAEKLLPPRSVIFEKTRSFVAFTPLMKSAVVPGLAADRIAPPVGAPLDPRGDAS
jgi:hypothetical protein